MPNDGTVKIGVEFDEKDIKSSFKDLQSSTKKTFEELEKLDDALKLDPKNVELIIEKQKLLGSAVNDAKKKVELLSSELDKAKASGLKEKDCNAYKKLADALSKAGSESKEFEARLKEVNNQIKNGGQKSDEFSSKLKTLGNASSKALKTASSAALKFSAAIAAAAGGILAAEAATEEYRIAQGKLNTAFEAAGYNTDVAKQAYTEFYTILGDIDTATEASQLLASLASSAEDISTWTNIAAGVYGTFGDALPIEGLIEASNETAKVGQVTGVLADALNWAGISEDDFNNKLAECSDETERNQVIMDTLSGTYDEATEAFYRNNDAIVESREKQAELQEAFGEIGGSITEVKNAMLEQLAPTISDIAGKFSDFISGLDISQIGEIIQGVIPVIQTLAPIILGAVAAVKAFTIAQAALNAVMNANPFVLIVTIIATLIASIITLWTTNEEFRNAVKDIWDGIKNAFKNAWEKIKEIWEPVGEFFQNVWDKISTVFSVVKDVLSGDFSGAWEGIKEVFDLGGWGEYFEGLWDDVKEAFANVKTWFKNVGRNLLKGIWNGIDDKIEWLKGKVKGVVDTIKGWFTSKEGFDEHSPSKWAQKVGEFVSQGLANGIEDGAEDVKKSAEELAAETYKTLADWAEEQINVEEVSLREQLDIWRAIKDQFVKDSEEFASAEEKIFDVRKQLLEENTALEKEYQDALKSRADEIFSIYDLFANVPEIQAVSGETLIENLQGQIDSIEHFYDSVAELSQREGIGQALVDEIRSMGPTATAQLDALLSLSDEKLQEYAELYEEKQSLANNIATDELTELRESTDNEIRKNLNAIEGVFEDQAPETGEVLTDGLAQGIKNGQSTVVSAAVGVAVAAINAANAEIARAIPGAQFNVSSANASMAPVSSPRFSAENAISAAAGLLSFSQSGNSREVVLQISGKELARALVPDIRSVESQSPAIVYG